MSTVKPATTTVTVAFHDQSIGLVVFGVLQIVLGCVCGIMALVIALCATEMPRFHPNIPVFTTGALVPAGVAFYLLPAVTLIWLGVGSILARRWSWVLTVILSWFWLIIGLTVVTAQLVFAPTIGKWIVHYYGKTSTEDGCNIQLDSVATMVVFYVFLPLAFLAFYQRVSVRATCNWRDSRTYWTDRCPMPVLAASIALASSVVWMSWWVACCCLLALFPCGDCPAWRAFSAICCFVTSLGGATPIAIGGGLWLLVMALSAFLARGVYRLETVAWWGSLLFCVASTAAGAWAFSQSSMIDLYETMCLPPYARGFAGRFSFAQPTPVTFNWLAILAGGITTCYLLCIHRYFVHDDATEVAINPVAFDRSEGK